MQNRSFVLVTAADKRFAWQALNLIGSVLSVSDIFETIFVYDLGMSPEQLRSFQDIPGVKIRPVTPFVEHWKACWSWKPWVWCDAPGEDVLYLDAGTEARGDLTPVLDWVKREGYFVVSQYESIQGGHTLEDIIPTDYYNIFGLNKKMADRPVVAGGLVGFSRNSSFYREVVAETLKFVARGYNLGWSESERWRNKPPHYQVNSPLRKCRYFRHDQSLFNLLLYRFSASPVIAPMSRFARVDRSHQPEVIISNDRLLSPLTYMNKIPYGSRRRWRNLSNLLRRWTIKMRPVYIMKVSKLRLITVLRNPV